MNLYKALLLSATVALCVGVGGRALAAESKLSAADLHTHSYCSDGVKTPEQVAEDVKRAGLKAFALSDHDAVACLARAGKKAAKLGLRFIPAVEMSAENDVHVLALGIDPESPAVAAVLKANSEERRARMDKIVAKLAEAGAPVDLVQDVLLPKLNRELAADGKKTLEAKEAAALGAEELFKRIHGQITRPDVARALVARGYVADNNEAFRKYLANPKTAEVPMNGPSFKTVIDMAHAAGGIAILAHPWTIMKGKFPVTYSSATYASFEELADGLIAMGLDGFEQYFPHPNAETEGRVQAVVDAYAAKGKELLLTPGSDYHGGRKQAGAGPDAPGGIVAPAEKVKRVLERLK